MGLITGSRHAGAPFANGEVLDGDDLENDISTIYSEFDGNIENANIASDANVNGSKLADASVANAKLVASTLQTEKFAASAVPKHAVSIIASETWTASTSLADVSGVTGASLTPGSTNDMIMMDFCATIDPSATGNLIFGWHVNGTDYDDVTSLYVVSTDAERIFYSSYAIAAPAASLMTIKPRHKVSGSAAAAIDDAVFRCWILPGK